jgi:hypothetical protein
MSRPATSRLKVNPAIGTMPVLQYCTPEQLLIDDSYQRTLETGPSQTLVRRIAMFWDWSLCQPLIVARRNDGGHYVVDGQHRLAAAKLRGDIFQLPCVVASYSSSAEEAASFVALNQQRRPLGALDLFKAALAADDSEAMAIMGALQGAGLSIAPHMNYTSWKPGMVSNIGGMQRAYRDLGHVKFTTALKVLAEAFAGEVLRYGGTIFPGIATVVGEKSAALDFAHLVAVLKLKSQADWSRSIHHCHAQLAQKWKIASATVIRDAYDHTGASGSRLASAPKLGGVEADCFPGEVWCGQCDRRVSKEHASRCVSPFCKAKAQAA